MPPYSSTLAAASRQSNITPSDRILIVDDEIDHCQLAEYTLQGAGYETKTLTDSVRTLDVVNDFQPTLVVLDIHMPKLDGFQVAQQLKDVGSPAEVLFLTDDKDPRAVIRGMDYADHYIPKPFNPGELVARAKRALMRAHAGQKLSSVVDALKPQIDPTQGVAHMPDGRKINLTPVNMRLLAALLAGDGQPVPNAQLLAEVWRATPGETNLLQSNIRRLRKEVEHDPSRPERIINIPKVGYCYVLHE